MAIQEARQLPERAVFMSLESVRSVDGVGSATRDASDCAFYCPIPNAPRNRVAPASRPAVAWTSRSTPGRGLGIE
jgi:hypothetical protein